MKAAHLADLHFSNNDEKREEVVRCSDAILDIMQADPPEVVILSGDVLDEHDGRIRLDSECARAAISFVERAADIAPVVIIRGTKSHDRDAPYIFTHLRCRYPIHVATEIEQVALVAQPSRFEFHELTDAMHAGLDVRAAFTLVPSVDKSYLMARFGGSISEGNMQTRELLHDLFVGLGLVNDMITCVPRIMVAHGMVTGAQFSTGQTAIGEDLEFGINDLQQAHCDYVALGHVHKYQCFPGNICYSGSVGRLNFGETEEKGFLLVEFDGQTVAEIKFHPTPARRFALHSVEWGEGGIHAVLAEADKCAASCQGADVRFRYTIPEEEKHKLDRDRLAQMFLDAGARKVKVEATVIPKQRTRAAGISRVSTLAEKIKIWGETTGTVIPSRVLALADVIEGREIDELVMDAEGAIGPGPVVSLPPVEAEPGLFVDEVKEGVAA